VTMQIAPSRSGKGARGGALVAVLWLSAALGMIAFSLASTVRGEIERADWALEGTRAYYLAAGALERTLIYMEWGPRYQLPDGSSRYFSARTSRLHFSFPAGEADVSIETDASRLNVNRAAPEEILRLLEALGVENERAIEITRAILDWRTPAPGGEPTEFDRYYLSLNPSFLARHASFRETEELLLLKGMTPEIFYGSAAPDAAGVLRPRLGLADCVTTRGGASRVDVNTAPAPVLAALGLNSSAIEFIEQARRLEPLRDLEGLRRMGVPGEILARLGVGGGSIYLLRSTARLRMPDGRLSTAVRTVGATVTFRSVAGGAGFQVLRWYERPWPKEEM